MNDKRNSKAAAPYSRNRILEALGLSACALALGACGANTDEGGTTPPPAGTKAQRVQKSAAGYQTDVEALYIAYFGRPADPGGLANFEAALSAAGAPTDIQGLATAYTTNATVKALIDSFGTSAESAALYGNGDSTAFVKAVFQNVLGRTPATSGLDFWSSAINGGSLTRGDAALSIMAGALNNTSAQGVLDAQLVNNHIAIAGYYTAQVTSQNAVS